MSYVTGSEEAFFNTLMSDEGCYPWNPYDEQTEEFLSKQEKEWDFTGSLTDSEVEERSANLFAQFQEIASNTSDSKCSPSNPLKLEQMEKELDNLAV